MSEYRLSAAACLGYVHLRVSDLPGALEFYTGLLGLNEIVRKQGTAYLSARHDRPYHVVLTEVTGARPKPPRTTGLYHVAIRLPDRPALARVLSRLIARDWPLQGAADHGVSEAIYLADPDGSGIELYTDRPRAQWTWSNGQISMTTEPLDVAALLDTVRDETDAPARIDPRADIGHVHLHVSDLARAEAFYRDLLGFEVTQRSYPGALFLAAGGYHHHLGLNIWAGRGAPPPPSDAAGLIAFAVRLPDRAAWQALVDRLADQGLHPEPQPADRGTALALVRDPDGIGVLLMSDAARG